MPRRKKVTINEALQVFKDHNLEVFVRPAAVADEVVETHDPSVVRKIGATTMVIDLYAQHCLGGGGSLVLDANGEKTVVDSATQTYGPGRVAVPTRIAAQLLHQDQLARRADERLLETKQRSYVIMQRAAADGRRANVGVEVDASVLNGFGFTPTVVL